MKALIQRVKEARVDVERSTVGEISQGLLVLLGFERHDDAAAVEKMLDRLLAYRVFADSDDRMNLSLTDSNGGLLLVSQFTLAADTKKGLRPGFSSAASPFDAQRLYDHALQYARAKHPVVAAGVFGANMQVTLVNDGPVTFLLES